MKDTIKRLRELEAKVTNGPWRKAGCFSIISNDEPEESSCLDGAFVASTLKSSGVIGKMGNIADLIVETRNALPKLLDYIEKLEAIAEAGLQRAIEIIEAKQAYSVSARTAQGQLAYEGILEALKEASKLEVSK